MYVTPQESGSGPAAGALARTVRTGLRTREDEAANDETLDSEAWAPFTEPQRRYLRVMAAVGVQNAACRAARISKTDTLPKWRDDPAFAGAELNAKEEFADRLEREAIRRAVEGVTRKKPHFYRGELIGEEVVQEYSDTLLDRLLQAKRPEVYRQKADVTVSAGGASPDVASLVAPEVAARLIAAYRGFTESEDQHQRQLIDAARAQLHAQSAQHAATVRAQRAEDDDAEDASFIALPSPSPTSTTDAAHSATEERAHGDAEPPA